MNLCDLKVNLCGQKKLKGAELAAHTVNWTGSQAGISTRTSKLVKGLQRYQAIIAM